MRKPISGIFIVLATGCFIHLAGAWESTWNYAVEVSSSVQARPPQITLSWPQDTDAIPLSYTVSRKAPQDASWGTIAVLDGAITNFFDTNVAVGVAYEYQLSKNASGYSGFGYIETGINVPLVEGRGKIVLIVDNSFTDSLAFELSVLEQDLVGDGWIVLRHDVSRIDSVVRVKALIAGDYNGDPANVKAVFLFGHVPVPYSGLMNPDEHPDHLGAWPADVYYGNIAGVWTDESVDYVQSLNSDPADAARMSNVPGDGKFDQTIIPSPVELEVGRVDLANMPGRLTSGGPPTFPSELELLRQYLNKDHNYRTCAVTFQRRGLVGDYLGVESGEAFAASAYRNFAAFFGADNLTNLNVLDDDAEGVWIPALSQQDYLWAYGCGPGSYSTIGGLGNTGQYNDGSTVEIVNNDVRSVFNLVFGSWFGDWDHEDDVMRAFLATPTAGLAAAWCGRPHWFVHPMGLGETIGSCARLTQNNTSLYLNQSNVGVNMTHIALMGDPSLRLHPVAPPGNVQGTVDATGITLNWSTSTDAVVGYHVYRFTGAIGTFARLTEFPVSGTSFVDTSPPSGPNTYMVRAIKLESTTSGSYFNPSQGVFWSTDASQWPADTTPLTVSIIAPTKTTLSGVVTLSANASGSVPVANVDFQIDGAEFGLSTPTSPYNVDWDTTTVMDGQYIITATASDGAGNEATSSPLTVWVRNNSPVPSVSIAATIATALRVTQTDGVITIVRTGDTSNDLTVSLSLGGTAINGGDYQTVASTATIPAGSASARILVAPDASASLIRARTVTATLTADATYIIGTNNSATVTILGNSISISSIATVKGGGMRITWPSSPGRTYHVAGKSDLSGPWTDLSGVVTATDTTSSWTDVAINGIAKRFYLAYVVN